jgi:aminoglycoside phosphotransferase (APT) family kinase protein
MNDQRDGLPGLDAARVSEWMAAHVAGAVAPLAFSVISGGHSNLTYKAVDAAGQQFVVRRPPLAAGAAKAHDVGREHRVIAALGPTDVPVPPARGLCEDESVNGAPFYVMDLVDAHVVDNPAEADRCLADPAARRRASEQIVDVLADLHRVDVDAVGLGDAARREGFLERQLARYQKVWGQNQTRELPLVDQLHARLVAAQPPQRYTGIVHSDYRFGNVMVEGSGRLAAVLDWELWTLGDVLADVGFLLNNWYEPGETTPLIWMEVPPTVAGGFASRAEVAARYGARTGFDLSDIEYYRAFQHWKVAILAEGVKRRYETGALVSDDVDFDHMARRVIDLVELADLHLTAHQEGSR